MKEINRLLTNIPAKSGSGRSPSSQALDGAVGRRLDNGKSAGNQSDKVLPGTSQASGRDYVDVINQVFAELELAYHNQFHKAYAQDGALALAKKYWLGVLKEFSPEVILAAVRQVVRQQEYLPAIAAIVAACENAYGLFGLPTARAAYAQACLAPEPKAEYHWSHPAVFFAAQMTGFFELAAEPQAQIFPLFEYNYHQICARVVHGENLELPVVKALPEKSRAVLSLEENKQRLQALRKQFGL